MDLKAQTCGYLHFCTKRMESNIEKGVITYIRYVTIIFNVGW